MKNLLSKNLARVATAIAVLVISAPVMAAGPLAVCNSGEPFLWPGGGANVPFNPDQGNLGTKADGTPFTNAEATAAVTEAFDAWGAVGSATISYTNAGALPVDVDETNFVPFLQPAAPDGLSAIVYDDTGAIFAALFGPGSGVLGFAGPEWINPANCTILEGVSFLNGAAFDSIEGLLDLMVHEFGHYSNLAHTVVNGQIFAVAGETTGPNPNNTFGFPPPNPDGGEVIETMYPFLFFGIDQLARTPNADDVASISQLYPSANFAGTTGTISGTIFSGLEKVTGVNVIARNVADPFGDAVSGISSDFTDDFSQANPFTGLYTIRGLTPNQSYAVYIDEILAGGFSTPPASPLPGPEEFYNGINESQDGSLDMPNEFSAIMAVAGVPSVGIDIIFNIPPPGASLPTGDDGNVEIPLPFAYCVAGQTFGSVFINGNGFLTFGAEVTGFAAFVESAAGMASGPPRVAGLWDDLNPTQGGSVFYQQTDSTFSVTWDQVPEFFSTGSNTVTITLYENADTCLEDRGSDLTVLDPDVTITHGEVSATDGLVGISSGAFATSGFEDSSDLSADSQNGSQPLGLGSEAAIFEQFATGELDLANGMLTFVNVGQFFKDKFEVNDTIRKAKKVRLPFDTISTRRRFSGISPAAGDIDFYRFRTRLQAGTTLVAEVLTGQVDTVMGLFRCDTLTGEVSTSCRAATAELVAFNDDSNGLLSRIQYEVTQTGTYALGVTFCCDYDFDGVDPGQGAPLDHGRYVLDVFSIDGVPLNLGDDSSEAFDLGFDFPYQGGSYSSVNVNSNGNLTFGGGDNDFSESVPEFENGLPRIAPLWVDLSPNVGGMVLATRSAGSATISFMGVPEFFFGGSNTFSVTLNADGSVAINYGGMTAPEGLSGLAEGGGAPGTAVDLSSSVTWPATGTTYESFPFGVNVFDLEGSMLLFTP